jgi:DNA alkylation damage repair protein AlkB
MELPQDDDDPTTVLRQNEKLLRGCASVKDSIALIPSLIHDPASSPPELISHVGKTKHGRDIYILNGLAESCYYIPGYLDHCNVLELVNEILTRMIDSPPNSNSLDQSRVHKHLWTEYSKNPDDLSASLNRLRWSCVGFHYNWGERSYNKSAWSQFPKSFVKLYSSVLDDINETVNGEKLSGFPQSAIINFYHGHRISDRLGGHRDDVEETDSTPLLSLSMGRSGIFLIENQAICLRSGDVLVMAQKARQSLHGVPVVFPVKRNKSELDALYTDRSWRENVGDFLEKTRISISIRQVY